MAGNKHTNSRQVTVGVRIPRFRSVATSVFLNKHGSHRSQNGIQMLLATEQEGQHIVNATRTPKMARLKQAKEEAEKEIADFRAQMEVDFQRKVTESNGDLGANVKRLEQETQAKIHHLNAQASRISNDIVRMLLKHVTTVKN